MSIISTSRSFFTAFLFGFLRKLWKINSKEPRATTATRRIINHFNFDAIGSGRFTLRRFTNFVTINSPIVFHLFFESRSNPVLPRHQEELSQFRRQLIAQLTAAASSRQRQ